MSDRMVRGLELLAASAAARIADDSRHVPSFVPRISDVEYVDRIEQFARELLVDVAEYRACVSELDGVRTLEERWNAPEAVARRAQLTADLERHNADQRRKRANCF